jgi:hypothetical protein
VYEPMAKPEPTMAMITSNGPIAIAVIFTSPPD